MKPDASRLLSALETTWPAAETLSHQGWRLRRGLGGGSRVSACIQDQEGADIEAPRAQLAEWGQKMLFQVRAGEDALDQRLEAAGYVKFDATTMMCVEASALLDDRPETARVIRGAAPVALMEEIWAEGGIGLERLAVMARAPGPKCYLLGRLADRPAAVAFVGLDGDIAMVHALETVERARRTGAGRMLMAGAARFAVEFGASWLALAVTERNIPAISLYRSLGMENVTGYHYRKAAE